MRLYFYYSAPQRYKAGFRLYYLPYNIKSLRLLSGAWLLIALLVIGSDYVFDYSAHFKGANLYRIAYYSYAGAGVLVYLLSLWLRKNPACGSKLPVYRYLYLGYAYVFAITCLLMSVAAQGNPMNNMLMYLLGLALVSTLFVFELRELLLLAALVEATFAIGVTFLDLPTERLIMNQTGSIFLVLFFFLLSRLNYSFRLNHFIQLQQIEQKNTELQKLSKAKTSILGIVAHDLRGPYANIEMMARMLQSKSMPAEQQQRFYDMILASCQSGRIIIGDLLDMARLEQEEACELVPTDLNSFLADIEREWKLNLRGARQFTAHVPDSPVLAELNTEKFKRVLDNLISNAVKFTKEDGCIRLSLLQEDENVLLQVSDDGIGIPEEMKPYLFEPFSKAGRRGVRGEQSVGLGLSITRKLVELQHGKIEVVSQPHRGAMFRITLPAASREAVATCA